MSTLSTYTLLLSYYWLQKQGDPVYKKILHEQLPKVLLLETFGGPCLTWNRAAEVQKSAGGRPEQVDAGHEDEWRKDTRGRMWGEGLGTISRKLNFFAKNYQNGAFSWHLRKFCWPFYVVFTM